MVKLNVNEIFGPTVQGEGMWAGRKCIFVRLNGCNLRCMFINPDGKTYTKCDTPYTSWEPEKANMMTPEDILDAVDGFNTEGDIVHVIITGGEPYLQKGLEELVTKLREFGYAITIETNGTIYKPFKVDLLSISPKLKTSTPTEDNVEARKLHIKNRVYDKSISEILESGNPFQFKFVYSDKSDIEEIEDFRQKYNIRKNDIWLMPQGADTKTLMSHTKKCMDAAIENGYNFTSRLHVLAYGAKRGV